MEGSGDKYEEGRIPSAVVGSKENDNTTRGGSQHGGSKDRSKDSPDFIGIIDTKEAEKRKDLDEPDLLELELELEDDLLDDPELEDPEVDDDDIFDDDLFDEEEFEDKEMGDWETLRLFNSGAVRKLSAPKRKALVILLDQPGLTIKDVAEALGVTHTTAGRHLRGLCNKGIVIREKEGSMERHYVVPAKEPRSLSWLRVTIQDELRYAIVEFLVVNRKEDMTVNQIANELNIYHGRLLRTLELLKKHRFVELIRPGSWYYVQVNPNLVDAWRRIHGER